MKSCPNTLAYPLTVCSLVLALVPLINSCTQTKAEPSSGPSAIAQVAPAENVTQLPKPKKTHHLTNDLTNDKSNPIDIRVLANNQAEPYYLVDKGKNLEFQVNIKTKETPGSKIKLNFNVTDFWNQSIYRNESETTVGNNNLIQSSYKFQPEKLGYYQIEILVNQQNLIEEKKARKFTYSFGVVDPAIATAKLDPESPFGICMRGKIIDNSMIQTLQRVGIKWVRNGILARWSDVEKDKGKFNYTENSDFIRRLNAHGISRLERLDGIAPWERQSVAQHNPATAIKEGHQNKKNNLNSLTRSETENIISENNPKQKKKKKKVKDPGTLMLPKNIDAWKNYVQTTVTRLYPSAAYYEVWNEPDIPKQYWRDSMENYVKLLNAGYDAKKQAHPEASILMAGFTGGFSNPDKPQKREWFELVLRTGKYDVINFHSYGGLALHEQRYKDLNDILRKYNLPKKPIWVTETGSLVWHAEKPKKQAKNNESNHKNGLNDDLSKIFSEREQARNYIQNFLVAKSYGVDKLFTHANVDATHNEDYGVIRKNNTPRPWMLAQSALSKWMNHAKFVKSTQDETLRKFVFQQNGKAITALFNTSGKSEKFQIDTDSSVEFIDMMGNVTNQVTKMNNNKYSVSIDDYPMYIVGAMSKIQKVN